VRNFEENEEEQAGPDKRKRHVTAPSNPKEKTKKALPAEAGPLGQDLLIRDKPQRADKKKFVLEPDDDDDDNDVTYFKGYDVRHP